MERRYLLAVALALVAGCGGDAVNDSPPPSDEQQVADAANAILESFRTGDGSSCDLMTSRGQRVVTRVVHDAGLNAMTCEGAIAAYADRAAERTGANGGEPEVISLEEVTISGSGAAASAASDFRGSMRFRLVDGTWLASLPVFSD